MSQVLVTGAGGHLGNNLVRALLADGQPVRALLHGPGERLSLAGLDVETMIGDLRDPALVARAVEGCDSVYHCAARVSTVARDAPEIFACNVLATRALLAGARAAGVRRVVVTSSFSAVGNRADGRPSDETEPFDPFAQHLPYEHSKAAAEHECLKALADGLDVVIATSTAIIGPNDFKPSRMGRVLLDFARGRLPAYIPGGFEFVATEDIVAGHRLAMARGRPGQKYILSSGFMTMDEIMRTLHELTGMRLPLRLPPAPMRAVAALAQAASMVAGGREPLITPAALRLLRLGRRADIAKARTELGYSPGTLRPAFAAAQRHFIQRGLLPSPGSRVLAGAPADRHAAG
jgi:nucleoside-diphosphate-sugar epimerase